MDSHCNEQAREVAALKGEGTSLIELGQICEFSPNHSRLHALARLGQSPVPGVTRL